MHLDLLPGRWSVVRLPPGDPVPEWAWSSTLSSVTRTAQELSILTPGDQVPPGMTAESGFCALVVRGPLAFTMTGVLAELSGALADAEIPIFVISTYDTDVVLVPGAEVQRAVQTLRDRGHDVTA